MVKKIETDEFDAMADELFEMGGRARISGDYATAATLLKIGSRIMRRDIDMSRDNSQLTRDKAVLQEKAETDALTELPNRAGFYRAIQHELAESKRIHDMVIALAYVDLDGFKEINDRFGHEKGDEILVEVAMRLQEYFRDTDTVCRMGGDEMVIIMPYDNSGDFKNAQIAQKVREALDGLYVWDDGQPKKAGDEPRTPGPYPIGASVGISSSNEVAVMALETPEEKMAKMSQIADDRMYRDKWRDGVHTEADRNALYHPKHARLEALRAKATLIQNNGSVLAGPFDLDV